LGIIRATEYIADIGATAHLIGANVLGAGLAARPANNQLTPFGTVAMPGTSTPAAAALGRSHKCWQPSMLMERWFGLFAARQEVSRHWAQSSEDPFYDNGIRGSEQCHPCWIGGGGFFGGGQAARLAAATRMWATYLQSHGDVSDMPFQVGGVTVPDNSRTRGS